MLSNWIKVLGLTDTIITVSILSSFLLSGVILSVAFLYVACIPLLVIDFIFGTNFCDDILFPLNPFQH